MDFKCDFGTDRVVRHRDTPKIYESLTTIDNHSNCLQRHISKTTAPDNVTSYLSDRVVDLCIGTSVDYRDCQLQKSRWNVLRKICSYGNCKFQDKRLNHGLAE